MKAVLNRFISRSANRCQPLFQLLHKWKNFEWTKECVVAFEELKQYLSHPPILSQLEKEEVLYSYIAITDHAVSPVLVRMDAGVESLSTMLASLFKKQKLITYPRRSNFGYHICVEEISLLFPSEYRRGPHPTSSIGVALEIRLYEEDCQIGNDA